MTGAAAPAPAPAVIVTVTAPWVTVTLSTRVKVTRVSSLGPVWREGCGRSVLAGAPLGDWVVVLLLLVSEGGRRERVIVRVRERVGEVSAGAPVGAAASLVEVEVVRRRRVVVDDDGRTGMTSMGGALPVVVEEADSVGKRRGDWVVVVGESVAIGWPLAGSKVRVMVIGPVVCVMIAVRVNWPPAAGEVAVVAVVEAGELDAAGGRDPSTFSAAALLTQASSTPSVLFMGRAKQLVPAGHAASTKLFPVEQMAVLSPIQAAWFLTQGDWLVKVE